MTRDHAVRLLTEHGAELRAAFAVKSLAIFGSVARGEAGPGSDVDLLVEYDRPIGLLHHIGTAQHLEHLLGVPKVDLVPRESVVEELKDIIYGAAIDVLVAPQMEVPPPAHAGSRSEDSPVHQRG